MSTPVNVNTCDIQKYTQVIKKRTSVQTYPESRGVKGGARGDSLERDWALESAAPGDKVDGVLGVDRPDPPPPASPPPMNK